VAWHGTTLAIAGLPGRYRDRKPKFQKKVLLLPDVDAFVTTLLNSRQEFLSGWFSAELESAVSAVEASHSKTNAALTKTKIFRFNIAYFPAQANALG
jgi:hypothetical protein